MSVDACRSIAAGFVVALTIAGCGRSASVPVEGSRPFDGPGPVSAVFSPESSSGHPAGSAARGSLTADASPALSRSHAPAAEDSGAGTVPDSGSSVATQAPRVERVYRPPDTRPKHDDARAGELGIARYESQRLILYTDIEPDVARPLPALLDQAYDAWVEYFGPLPPDRAGAEYQITGYIMRDRDRFRAAGMLPDRAFDLLQHGIHRGAEFWMNDQEYAYYRRHLMIHEGTHCFMTVLPGQRPPVWYLEGMAEYFGTHQIDDDGRATFGVMPDRPEGFVGFGRVEMVRDAIDDGQFRSVGGVVEMTVDEFSRSRSGPYAWSWAFSKFLDAHPRYQARFRALGQHLVGQEFHRLMRESFAPDMPVLSVEWELFAHSLEYGYDVPRAAIDFRRGTPLPAGGASIDVQSDRGWQPSGIFVEAGQACVLSATGRVSLAREPKPWISEPPGISIRYASGRPIGRLLAGLQSETAPDTEGHGSLRKVIDVGGGLTLMPPVSGTLYFRVNDFWSELGDNEGVYQVTVSAKPGVME
jgi:hypothetical protein